MEGEIVLGALAPHPPHLVYAENPPENEPNAECGWEGLRWGYHRLAKKLSTIDYDAIVIFSPHWQTYIGTHFLGVPHFESISVDPVFPNLFRYSYSIDVDVGLAEAMAKEASDAGMVTRMMRNPDFRIDYGTIVSGHMVNPTWSKPIVTISSQRSTHYYSAEVMGEQMHELGQACKRAIKASGKKVVLLSSNSLSHRHFVTESDVPEDMSKEHIYNHSQYLWDMRMIELMREGRTREMVQLMPEFTEQSIAETDAGGLSWLMSALDYPDYGADVHAYGTVIGTGNAIVEWDPRERLTLQVSP